MGLSQGFTLNPAITIISQGQKSPYGTCPSLQKRTPQTLHWLWCRGYLLNDVRVEVRSCSGARQLVLTEASLQLLEECHFAVAAQVGVAAQYGTVGVSTGEVGQHRRTTQHAWTGGQHAWKDMLDEADLGCYTTRHDTTRHDTTRHDLWHRIWRMTHGMTFTYTSLIRARTRARSGAGRSSEKSTVQRAASICEVGG
jgi:hypothetical protein